MSRRFTLAIVSDIHYASDAERARGDDYEYRDIHNSVRRAALYFYRHFIWMRHFHRNNAQLDRFLAEVADVDYAIGDGDYSCNTDWVGVADDAAFQSCAECFGKLRKRFGDRLRFNIGDHELGKMTVFGDRGGMRLASWRRATGELGMQPFWRVELGNYVLFGIASSLVALPVIISETLPEERASWEQLREEHLTEIRAAFASLQPHQRVLLFCHDPTALPFLGREEIIRAKLAQIEHTIIGHLHSNLYLWKSKILAGMPVLRFCGHTVKKLSTALNEARHWKPFRVRLCPSLAGIELLKDGGYLKVDLDAEAKEPARFTFQRLRR